MVVGRMTGDPVGMHRVLEPLGALPQAAERLDTDPVIRDDEVRVRVQRLNLDAASFRQLEQKHGGDGDAVRAEVLEIVGTPRQDAQPGDRVRRHARRHRRGGGGGLPAGPCRGRPRRHPGLADPHPARHRGRPRRLGRAQRAGARIRLRDPVRPQHRREAARRPADATGPRGDGRVRRARPDRAARPPVRRPGGRGHRWCREVRVAVPGGSAPCRSPAHARRRTPPGRGRPARAHRARRPGARLRRPRPGGTARRRRRRRGTGRPDHRVRGRARLRGWRDPRDGDGRHGAVLLDGDLVHRCCARRRGAGRRRDHGRGQRLRPRSRRPGARARPLRCWGARAVREEIGSMVEERRRSVSKPGAEEARPRPGHRPQGAQPRPQGRPADRAARPGPHHGLGRAGDAAARGPRRRRPRRHALGQPARRRRTRRRRAGARPRAAGVGRPAARRGRGPRDARPEGLGRFHALPAARGSGGPEGAHCFAQAGRRPAYAASTHGVASASG